MFLFPTTILAIVAIALIHHGAGFGLMNDEEIFDDLIFEFHEKPNVNSAEVLKATKDFTKFPIDMVDNSASNINLVLFYVNMMRSPWMSSIIRAFYERLYNGKKMTDADLEKMAEMLLFLENGQYFRKVDDEAATLAVLSLFNQHGRHYANEVIGLYNATKEQTAFDKNKKKDQ